MKLNIFRILALVALGILIAGGTNAQSSPTGSGKETTAKPSDNSRDIDPAAVAVLDKMGAYLRSLKAFEIKAAITRQDVYDDGSKIDSDEEAHIVAQRPNRFRVELSSDRGPRFLFYNGKTFTVFAPLVNYYATVPAPGTISEVADHIQQKFDIDLPLADLFYWGTDRAAPGKFTGAMDVGPSQVDGVTCEQYAYRQEGLVWQIWIQNGDYPLPRKLVLTTMDDEARPEYRAVFAWNLAPSFDETAFEFVPPEGAHKIVLAEAKTEPKP